MTQSAQKQCRPLINKVTKPPGKDQVLIEKLRQNFKLSGKYHAPW